MRRREFIALLGGAAAWPTTVHAQQPARTRRVAIIALVAPLSELVGPDPVQPAARWFLQAFRELGYADGKNVIFEWRSAEGKLDDLPRIVKQLATEQVDVILSISNLITQAAKNVTDTIPIVMAGNALPVESASWKALPSQVATSQV